MSRLAAAVTRTTVEPVLLRFTVLVAGAGALLIALPAGLPGPVLALAAVLPVLPAVWPRGPWATVVVLAAVAGWLVHTGVAALLPGVTGAAAPDAVAGVEDPGRLLLLAGALYLLHTLTALAATLPYDAVVAPEVLGRWLLRAAGVLLASSLLSVGVLVAVDRAVAGRTYLAATLGGLAVAAGLAFYLRRLVRVE